MSPLIEPLEPRQLLTADLTGTFISKLPTALPLQATNHLTVRITNQGDALAAGPANVLLYASTDPALDAGDTLLTTSKVKFHLKPGQSSNVVLKFTSPTTLSTGAYFLLAEVIDGSTITEQNTANNVFSTLATVVITAPFVDLSDTIALSPKTTSYTVGAKKQTPFKFTVDVFNKGNVLAKGRLAISLFGSNNTTYDLQDPLLLNIPVKQINIKAGAEVAYAVTFKPTIATQSGTFYAIAQISPAAPIVESNLDNDTAATSNQLTITNPALPAHPSFVGGLTDNVLAVFVGTSQQVTFSVTVADETPTTAVELDEVDAAGNPISKIADLQDGNSNGNVTGIFTAVVSISFDMPTTRYFVATLTDPTTGTSAHTVALAVVGASPISPG